VIHERAAAQRLQASAVGRLCSMDARGQAAGIAVRTSATRPYGQR